MTILVVSTYSVILLALLMYGLNGYWLLYIRRERAGRATAAEDPQQWPSVVVQLPLFNERDVATRAIKAAGELTYEGRLEIQVLDDSTDDTSEIAAAAVERLRRQGIEARLLRRGNREGFKAGALAHGIEQTDAELFLILDADFLPEPDFLTRCVRRLAPGVACVQGRWGHLNREHSTLTRGQALAIDVHFIVEQTARACANDWSVSFNGTAGLWRREALIDAGGWSADTLTEDLDLSYRAWLKGWRIVYDADAVCPAEVPETMLAFKAQQRRWATGSTAAARKLLGPIWRASKPLSAKVQATIHLTHYAVHPLILLSVVLAVPLGKFASAGNSLWSVLPALALATGGPVGMSLAAAKEMGMPRRVSLRDTWSLMMLGTGLAVSNTIAVWRGLGGGGRHVFERTPKGGEDSSYALGRDLLAIVELASAVGCALLAVCMAYWQVVALVPFFLLYALGLARVGMATLTDGRRQAWQSKRSES